MNRHLAEHVLLLAIICFSLLESQTKSSASTQVDIGGNATMPTIDNITNVTTKPMGNNSAFVTVTVTTSTATSTNTTRNRQMNDGDNAGFSPIPPGDGDVSVNNTTEGIAATEADITTYSPTTIICDNQTSSSSCRGSDGRERQTVGENSTDITTTSPVNVTGDTNVSSTAPTKPIVCYNCSETNCNNVASSNISTCISNTGICYIQYDATATVMTLSCSSLYQTGQLCISDYAAQAAGMRCEFCCMTTHCNMKTSSDVQKSCLSLLFHSSANALTLKSIILALTIAGHLIFYMGVLDTQVV